MLIIALRKGGGPCFKDCPFYSESGVVKGFNGPLKTHCSATMKKVIVDCDHFDTKHIEHVEVSEEQWQTMLHAVHKRATRVIKPLPDNHAEIHPVGYNWRHQDKWNAQKSLNIKH